LNVENGGWRVRNARSGVTRPNWSKFSHITWISDLRSVIQGHTAKMSELIDRAGV
jgi:hypothetical protein